MPYYKGQIIVRPIDCNFGFVAENIKEAKIRMNEKMERLIDDNTLQVCEEVK